MNNLDQFVNTCESNIIDIADEGFASFAKSVWELILRKIQELGEHIQKFLTKITYIFSKDTDILVNRRSFDAITIYITYLVKSSIALASVKSKFPKDISKILDNHNKAELFDNSDILEEIDKISKEFDSADEAFKAKKVDLKTDPLIKLPAKSIAAFNEAKSTMESSCKALHLDEREVKEIESLIVKTDIISAHGRLSDVGERLSENANNYAEALNKYISLMYSINFEVISQINSILTCTKAPLSMTN